MGGGCAGPFLNTLDLHRELGLAQIVSLFFVKLLGKQFTHRLPHIVGHVPGASHDILAGSAIVVVEDFVGIEALAPFIVDDASGGHAFPHPLILIPNNISALPGVVVFQRTVLLVWFKVTGFGVHYGWIR